MKAAVDLFDTRSCILGEAPFWHPQREQVFWVDILGQKLLSQKDGIATEWAFDECVSAIGWIDRNRLLIASENRLFQFDLETEDQSDLCDLESAVPTNRSNDGRADPFGGFWIGTMSKTSDPGRGAFYRWYRGELRRLFDGITVPNATCFSPDGRRAYFTDTLTRRIETVDLDEKGWPAGAPRPFVTVREADGYPDGAIVDGEGCLWCAYWGGGCVVRLDPDGREIARISVPTAQSSCPALAGPQLTDLYVTSAAIGQEDAAAGQTFVVTGLPVVGQAEHQVIL